MSTVRYIAVRGRHAVTWGRGGDGRQAFHRFEGVAFALPLHLPRDESECSPTRLASSLTPTHTTQQCFSLNNGQCVACKSGCLECADGTVATVPGTNICLRCLQGLYPTFDPLSDSGKCVLPTDRSVASNCAQLSEISAQRCAVCQAKFALTSLLRRCVPCAPDCAQCTSTATLSNPTRTSCDVLTSA